MLKEVNRADDLVLNVRRQGHIFTIPGIISGQVPEKVPAWTILRGFLATQVWRSEVIADEKTLTAISRASDNEKLPITVQFKPGFSIELIREAANRISKGNGDSTLLECRLSKGAAIFQTDFLSFIKLCDLEYIQRASIDIDRSRPSFDFTDAAIKEKLTDHCPLGETTILARAELQSGNYIFRTISSPLSYGTSPIQQFIPDDGRPLTDYLTFAIKEFDSFDYARSKEWKAFLNKLLTLN